MFNTLTFIYIRIFHQCMKKSYPDFRKEKIRTEKLYKALSTKEKIIIDDFLKFCSISAGVKKISDIKGIILQIHYVMECPLDVISLDDVRSFLSLLNQSHRREWTKHGIKVTLKRFLKWKYPDWSSRFNQLADIKLKKVSTQDRYTEDKLLTEEDIEKMLRKAETLREKSLLIMLFETGARPQEIVNLKWKNLSYEGNHGLVNIYSEKTHESRTVPIKESVIHLKRWHQEFSFPDVRQNDFVFPAPRDRTKPMNDTTLWYLLKRLAKKTGVQKNVYAYLFRHVRARELYEELPEQLAKKLLGHAKDSRMPSVYSHTRDKKAIQAMLNKIYHIEEITHDKQLKLEKEIEDLKKELIQIRQENKYVLITAKKMKKLLNK